MEKNFDKIVNHVTNSGFLYQGSAIYGGLANSWDYGPLGTHLKMNIKKLWWQKFVQEQELNVGLDSAILMNPKVWEASGHLANFADPLMDCKNCKARFRADKLIEEHDPTIVSDGWSNEKLFDYIQSHDIKCPKCGSKNFTDIRKFQLMFKTHQGVVEDSKSEVYLRPETAQGIFVNFKNILRTTRKKIPFGVCQIGKAFRNEITPGNFIFRTREFEQMELEFFCAPGTDLDWYRYWKDYCWSFLNSLGISNEKLRIREHSKEELAHYSKGTSDIEYLFPFGWGEVWGISDRGDYDLSQHSKFSGEKLDYLSSETNERFVPYVVEPSLGVDRLLLTLLVDAYEEEELEKDMRIVMRFHPLVAPVQVAVFPLSRQLSEGAKEVFNALTKLYHCEYDESGSIGKRYRRQDAIGTPFCITYDFESKEDGAVTVRERDSMKQERVAIKDLKTYLGERLVF